MLNNVGVVARNGPRAKTTANRIKGLAVLGHVKTVKRVAGEPRWDLVLSHLDSEIAEALRFGTVIPGGWYPLEWYCEMYEAAHKAGLGDIEFARRIGFDNVHRDLTSGVYRIVLKVVSPQYLLSKAPNLFSSYYEHGAMIAEEARPGLGLARWEGCAGFNSSVWADVIGGCEGALVAAGAVNVQVDVVRGGGDGDSSAAIEARWKP